MAGDYMKRLLLTLLTLIVLITPVNGYTSPKEDYEEAYKIYIAAGASVAAYSGRLSELTRRYLKEDGWKLGYYTQAHGHAGARYILAQKEFEGTIFYVLAIVGTENAEDIRLDLKVDKVYFAGTDFRELADYAAAKDVPETEPKVHRGFYEFLEAGPAATLTDSRQQPLNLPEVLKRDKNSKIFITGHSLGGAAATLAGAGLISVGVDPSQVEVITFGAPAVGNAAFAAKFEPLLRLTRIVHSGDQVTGVLQTLVGGYRQFGRLIQWDPPEMADNPHKLFGYVDSAMKNFYNKRSQAIAAGVDIHNQAAVKRKIDERVYVAPIQNNLPSSLASDFWYMNEFLKDEFKTTLANDSAGLQTSLAEWRTSAAKTGCRWLVVPDVSAVRIKQEKNIYYITVSETVYEAATGNVVDMATYSTATFNLTPLEAFFHAVKEMDKHLHRSLKPNN
jgi:hypothetical protein